MKKKTVFTLITILISMFVIGISVEVFSAYRLATRFNLQDFRKIPAYRKVQPYKENPYIVSFKPFSHAHKPHSEYQQSTDLYSVHYRINEMGFRGFSFSKKQRDKRILVIGDSQVEGHGVDFSETFSEILNNEFINSEWEILNVGNQGGSPVYYALNLDRYLALKPDAVLLTIHDNDLKDDSDRIKNYLNMPYIENFFQPNKLSNIIFDRKTYILLNTIWKNKISYPSNELEKIIFKNSQLDAASEGQVSSQSGPDYAFAPAHFEKKWGESEKYLNYVVKEFRQRNIAFYVMYTGLGYTFPKSNIFSMQHSERMEKYSKAWSQLNGIPYFSMLPAIRLNLSSRGPELLIPGDGHASVAGHHLIASKLSPWLRKELR
ncbi:MAG: SGNH/GDSL hydrolase family protein [Leptospira sp.]|nr:SGNH/GDSL hydrolase family protein [Leptospira sp.]